MRSRWFVSTVAAMAVALCATLVSAAAADKANEQEVAKMTAAMPTTPTVKPTKVAKVLVFSLTKGFHHDSIPICSETFKVMGQKIKAWETVESTDTAMFAPEKLKDFDAIIMNNTTSEKGGELTGDPVLKAGLIDFVKSGKGIVGIHSATDCWYNFKDYGDMMGGFFAGHPFGHISVKVDDPKSPLTAAFKGKGFEINDEIYTFKDPYSRDKLHILLSVDWTNSGNLKGGTRPQDNDYALSWIHEYGKGRVFYSAFGHKHEICWNPAILQSWMDGMQYVLGDLKADATPSTKLSPAPEAAPGPTLGGAPKKDAPAKKADSPAKKADAAAK